MIYEDEFDKVFLPNEWSDDKNQYLIIIRARLFMLKRLMAHLELKIKQHEEIANSLINETKP